MTSAAEPRLELQERYFSALLAVSEDVDPIAAIGALTAMIVQTMSAKPDLDQTWIDEWAAHVAHRIKSETTAVSRLMGCLKGRAGGV